MVIDYYCHDCYFNNKNKYLMEKIEKRIYQCPNCEGIWGRDEIEEDWEMEEKGVFK